MEILVADLEADGLLDSVTQIWCLAIGGLTGEPDIYADQPGYKPLREGIDRLEKADKVVFHNGLNYDYHVIERMYPGKIKPEQIIDTLVLSRLLNPERPGHSLEEWGNRLGFHKGAWDDWSRFDPLMADYCKQDIRVTQRVYAALLKEMRNHNWEHSIQLEHHVAFVLSIQELHGFKLNLTKSIALVAELRQKQDEITVELQKVFPPRVIERYSEKTGKRLKDKVEVFNPGSRKQIASRLSEMYGWRPEKFTPSGSPQIDDAVLNDLDFPEAKLLARYFRIIKQLGQVADGDNAWLKLEKNGRVHGRVNPNGAVTGRMTHFKPNMAQVDKQDLRMREVWEADEGDKLVGCDAEGLELRMLAHYLFRYDKGEYAKAVVSGKKEDKSDVHSHTQIITGLYKRDNAKTLKYAYLYGAGDPKLGKIIVADAVEAGKEPPEPGEETFREAKKRCARKAQREHRKLTREEVVLTALGMEAREKLQTGITGLDKLVASVKKAHKANKFVRGLDGRKIFTRSNHSALNTLLQGAGAVVMKKALEVFHYDLAKPFLERIDYCANVHDEVQMSVPPELADEVGKTFAKAITEAGVRLGVRCPLAGAYDIGANWKETH